jgi:hypothetical protein
VHVIFDIVFHSNVELHAIPILLVLSNIENCSMED